MRLVVQLGAAENATSAVENMADDPGAVPAAGAAAVVAGRPALKLEAVLAKQLRGKETSAALLVTLVCLAVREWCGCILFHLHRPRETADGVSWSLSSMK